MKFWRGMLVTGGIALLTMCGDAKVSNEFVISTSTIAMPDGVELSVTYYIPHSSETDARFPVLFEMLPYRKDDFFYARDYPIYSDLARKGFLLAKVDVRGTGSSGGEVPEREYSPQEINDAVFVIDHLSKLPNSNGRVGMWGLSWGGFNALQVRARKPPALKAVLAIHASDDLFHDDIRYIDGILHMDSYAVEVDADVSLPRSPDYPIDEAYRRERFEREPWIFTYLKQQRDSQFWRNSSVRFDKSSNPIPLYLIGGLLDGYRDTVLRLFESQKGFVQAEIGPWGHDFPNEGTPGPNYEWRDRAAEFWNRWLRSDNASSAEKELIVYVRGKNLWKKIPWPSPSAKFYFSSANALANSPAKGTVSVSHHPGQGVAAGLWWGDPTEDLAGEDRHCATFDSPPLTGEREMVGFAQANFSARSDEPHLQWVVRLEDISPEGKVALVTGGALNSSQRQSRLQPAELSPREFATFAIPLHFTSWVFRAGHRIRLSVCLGQFPMFWPMAHRGSAEIHLDESAFLNLPGASGGVPVVLPPVREISEPPDIDVISTTAPVVETQRDEQKGQTIVTSREASEFRRRAERFSSLVLTRYETQDSAPEYSQFHGTAEREIDSQGKRLKFQSRVSVTSTKTRFQVQLRRQLSVDGKLHLERTWERTFPRDFQ